MALHRKQSEEELGAALRATGAYAKKARDRGYVQCPHCHGLVRQCPTCHQDMLLQKAETLPDFVVAYNPIYVECKQGETSWSLDDVSPSQEKVMEDWTTQGRPGFLFLLMGGGIVTKGGRQAWMIPWRDFTRIREGVKRTGVSSVRFETTERSRAPKAADLFDKWKLEWKNGKWTIPQSHEDWHRATGEIR